MTGPMLNGTSYRAGRPQEWRDRARCSADNPDGLDHPVDPETFWPAGWGGDNMLQVNEARTHCGLCRVRAECLNYAMDAGTRQPEGMWGGGTPKERDSLIRSRARARQTAAAEAREAVGCTQ